MATAAFLPDNVLRGLSILSVGNAFPTNASEVPASFRTPAPRAAAAESTMEVLASTK